MDAALELTLRAVRDQGPDCLQLDDFTWADLAKLAWSGTSRHVQHVADCVDRVDQGDMEYLVLRGVDTAPVAKAGIDYTETFGVGTITQLATHEVLKGMGLGSRLVGTCEERIRRRGLTKA